jgi:hypothetical protein
MTEGYELLDEIWFEIFIFIGIRLKHILRNSLVCKKWNEILHSNRALEYGKDKIERERSTYLLGRPHPKWVISTPKFKSAISLLSPFTIEVLI